MEITESDPWVYFTRPPEDGEQPLDEHLTGKWMHFYHNPRFEDVLCREAIREKIVLSCKYAKHFTAPQGVTCFYININDYASHKKLLLFMMKHHLFQTRAGTLQNSPFKMDVQTKLSQYGSGFKRLLTLGDFFDLHSQQWIATEESFAQKMASISDTIQDLNEQLAAMESSPQETQA